MPLPQPPDSVVEIVALVHNLYIAFIIVAGLGIFFHSLITVAFEEKGVGITGEHIVILFEFRQGSVIFF